MNTYFISDLHFGHSNIIKYSNRPFANTFIMDKELIKKWNNTVGKNDTVWFLGDLTLSKDKEHIAGLVHQLHGHKKMIIGNHDKLKIKDYYDMGFEFVSPVPVVLKGKFILSHIPFEDMADHPNMFYIYGHVHSCDFYATKTANSQCVCVERQDYKPITIEEFDNYKEPSPKEWEKEVGEL